MPDASAGAQPVLLSTAPATRHDWQVAVPVVIVLAAAFVVTLPYAKVQLAYVWAFIPTYQTALAIIDLMTAGLLLAQYNTTRSRALLVLGCAYFFTACLVVPHTLSFPGLFAEQGVLPGSNPKTTVWLYMFWHGGFPLAVIAYAWLKAPAGEAQPRQNPTTSCRPAIIAGAAVVLAAATGLTVLSTAGAALLPPLLHQGKYTVEMTYVSTGFWALSVAALLVLWRRRPHSVLDRWLIVVMCAWISTSR